MKGIRAMIIATIITCLIIVSCSYALPANAEADTAEADHGEFFPKLTIVVNKLQIGSNWWIITCRDRQGHDWEFYCDDGTWECGDIANLLMWDVNGEFQICEVYWEGYTENIEMFFHLTEWR